MKKACSFRLEETTLKKMDKLANFYSKHLPINDIPGQKRKITRTDLIEFLVKLHEQKLLEEGYEI